MRFVALAVTSAGVALFEYYFGKFPPLEVFSRTSFAIGIGLSVPVVAFLLSAVVMLVQKLSGNQWRFANVFAWCWLLLIVSWAIQRAIKFLL